MKSRPSQQREGRGGPLRGSAPLCGVGSMEREEGASGAGRVLELEPSLARGGGAAPRGAGGGGGERSRPAAVRAGASAMRRPERDGPTPMRHAGLASEHLSVLFVSIRIIFGSEQLCQERNNFNACSLLQSASLSLLCEA